MKRLHWIFAVSCGAMVALSACGGGPGGEVSSVATSTLAPIVSLTPRFTATPVASRTPLPTFTYTPSITPIPPTPSNTPTPTAVPPQMAVIQSSERVNIREGPSSNSAIINALDPGTGVEVLDQSPDLAWYNIQMEDGSQGWVSARLLFLQATVTPLPTLTPTPDLTALALGSPLPTALFGGGTITPTPPLAASTPTPVAEVTQDATQGTPVINQSAFNMTATALVSSITSGATGTAQQRGTADPSQPVGGPTGGPVNVQAGTLAPGAGQRGNISAQEGVDVAATCDNPIVGRPAPTGLRAGATIDIFWWWYAKTPELLQDHNVQAIYEVTVNGQSLTNWRQYAVPPVQVDDGDYYQYWYVPFGPLPAGQVEIEYRVTWREGISDGYSNFGPGTNAPFETGSCTFTVAP